MSKINKKIIVPSIITLAVILVSIYGANHVLADENFKYSVIVTKLAQKFNLKEVDVNEVFEQDRQEMWQNRQKLQEIRLGEAVTAGVITEEQKNKILERMNDWQANRTAESQEHREEMQKWMEENGIDHDKLSLYMGFGGRGQFGPKGMGMGMRNLQ